MADVIKKKIDFEVSKENLQKALDAVSKSINSTTKSANLTYKEQINNAVKLAAVEKKRHEENRKAYIQEMKDSNKLIGAILNGYDKISKKGSLGFFQGLGTNPLNWMANSGQAFGNMFSTFSNILGNASTKNINSSIDKIMAAKNANSNLDTLLGQYDSVSKAVTDYETKYKGKRGRRPKLEADTYKENKAVQGKLSEEIRENMNAIEGANGSKLQLAAGLTQKGLAVGFSAAASEATALGNTAAKVFEKMGLSLTSVFEGVMSEISQMTAKNGIASYGLSSSIFSNSSARTNAFKYGLSDSANYGMQSAMSALNMTSDEDLMYMNDTQKEYFNNLSNYYQAWYSELKSSGALESIQQSQLDLQILKQELAYKFLNWFANNKDVILGAIDVIMRVTLEIATTIANILNALSFGNFGKTSSFSSSLTGSLTTAKSSDTASYNSNNTSKQNNLDVKQNVTINTGANASDVANALNGSKETELQRWKQYIQELG